MKMIITREMEDAITTPGYAYVHNLGRRNYEAYQRNGLDFFKNLVSSYIYDNGITDPDRVREISNQVDSTENLSFLFSVVEKKYSLKPKVDYSILRNGGLSPKIKGHLFVAFLYAATLSKQTDLINDLNAEVQKTIQLDFVDPISFVHKKAEDAGFEDGIIKLISIERTGGTDAKPIFRGVLEFDGITVKVTCTNKKVGKRLLCKKWMEENHKRQNPSVEVTKTCPRKSCTGKVISIPGGYGKCQKCEEEYHFALLAN